MVEEVMVNVGRLQEARGCQKCSKKAQAGNQAGNHSGGDQLLACFPLLRPVYFLQIDQEDRLVSIVMMYACRGFTFTEVQLCKLACQIAVSEKKTGFSPTKTRGGRSWLKYFYKRQLDLKKKVASNLSIGRAMAANPGCIEKFFEDYSGWLKEWKLEYSLNSIWNVDECGIGNVPQMQKVIGVKTEKLKNIQASAVYDRCKCMLGLLGVLGQLFSCFIVF